MTADNPQLAEIERNVEWLKVRKTEAMILLRTAKSPARQARLLARLRELHLRGQREERELEQFFKREAENF